MKAKSRKQIKNSLKTVNVLKNGFKKAVIDTFGETDGIKFEDCHTTEFISGFGECPVYLVYDEKEDGQGWATSNKLLEYCVGK